MKKEKLPTYFSILNRGKITLYIKKKYEEKLSEQEINKFINLYEDTNELSAAHHGRAPCKRLSLNGLNGRNLVVRDYWHGGLFGKLLKNIFWENQRPLNELSICETAIERGIKTTEIMAIVKNKIMGPLYKCKLVSMEISDAVDLMELLYDENLILSQKRQIITKLAEAIRKMHDAGIYHRDLHLKNILIQKDNGLVKNAYIIDLDKSRQLKKIGLSKRMKNIMRLDRSLEKLIRNEPKTKSFKNINRLVTKTDRIRFFKEYIKSGSSSAQHDSERFERPLKYYLQSLSTGHRLHKFWWSAMGNAK